MHSEREDYAARMSADRSRVNARLDEILPKKDEEPVSLHGAMRHAVLSGGKRIRALLCIASHELFGSPHSRAALDGACALELLHAYTLVHDDLPALDDDDARRGMPSCHVAYGEAIAILAGDALQALAFETLSRARAGECASLRAVETLARTAGSAYLVAGQVADLEGEGKQPSEGMLRFIHMRKTAELIAASMGIGALLADASPGEAEEMMAIGRDAGYAFQIVDDLLDLQGDEQLVGKGLRKDSKKGKITHPALHGIERSRIAANELIQSAIERLAERKGHGYLRHLLTIIIERVS